MNTKKRILITGARAPYTLELIRALGKCGHTIYVAESLSITVSSFSKYIEKTFQVAPPRQKTESFIKQLIQIIQDYSIDLLLPTCEESFYISEHLKTIQSFCEVFTDSFTKVLDLHNKFTFIETMKKWNFNTPETFLVNDSCDLNQLHLHSQKTYIYKPVYSRFGIHVIDFSIDKLEELDTLKSSSFVPLVVQEKLVGKEYNLFAICYKGKVLSSAIYDNHYKSGKSSVYFRKIDRPPIQKWLTKVVEKINYTGFIGFDVMETNGSIYPLECNPRCTSGLHLIDSEVIATCIINKKAPLEQADYQPTKALIFGMLLSKKDRNWFPSLLKATDILWDKGDFLPFLTQPISLLPLWKRMIRERISLIEATTFDIEWNGDYYE